MLRRAKARGAARVAGVVALASLLLPIAAQGAAAQIAAPAGAGAAGAGAAPAGAMAQSSVGRIDAGRTAPWLHAALRGTISPRSVLPAVTRIGDFSACPALPQGYKPSLFQCFLIHITGGKLIMGASDQPINKTMTIAYAEGTGPNDNTALVFGSLKSPPMPVPGGIFLTPATNSFSEKDPKLQLSVRPQGIGMTPDLTGVGAGFMSMRIKAISYAFGAACHIGSRRDPLTVDPTFGKTDPPPPNKPIHGHVKSVTTTRKETIIVGTVVDNAFAAPGAVNCGPGGVLDPIVDAAAELPSPAGTNTAIFQVTVEIAMYTKLAQSQRAA